MKRKSVVAAVIVLALIALSIVLLSRNDDSADFLEKHAVIVMRDIGHKLMLHAGDDHSRVLPVRQLNTGIFQIEFESRFTFKPDTLAKIVQRDMATANLPLHYMVNVFDCSSDEMVYGFEISKQHTNIIPCRGRIQPTGCYSIQIAFFDFPKKASPLPVYILVLIIVACIAMLVVDTVKDTPKVKVESDKSGDAIAVGNYFFDVRHQVLRYKSETIELSQKETKILQVFAANQNQLIDRDHLLKEVWENEGVITGRSLDMFISKLRKKLSHDIGIRIANIHGRGYRLEISPVTDK